MQPRPQRSPRRPGGRIAATLVAAAGVVATELIGLPAQAVATIASVQKGTELHASTASVTPTLPAASTAGTLLVAVLGATITSGSFSLPSGWVIATSAVQSGSDLEEIAYYPDNPGGISSATFTATGASLADGQLTEWSGVLGTSPIDQVGTQVHGAATSITISTAAATSTSGELAITGFSASNYNVTYTPGSGWTNLFSDGAQGYTSDEQITAASGTISETETVNPSSSWSAVITTFKPAGAPAVWALQTAPATNQNLFAVACASATTCFAGGQNGTLITTTNSGSTWANQTDPTSQQVNAVACPGATTCFAVAKQGNIEVTTNGTSWSAQTSPTTSDLFGVSCTDTSHCWAVGKAGTGMVDSVIVTSNGGTSWAQQTSPTTQQLQSVACVNASHCWAVGAAGTIIAWNGTSWSAQTSPTTQTLYGVSCGDTSHCVAVGQAGTGDVDSEIATSNGGSTWAQQTTPTTQQLLGVDCIDATHCSAVGAQGTVITTSNGSTWSSQTSSTTQALNAVTFVNANRGWAVGGQEVIDAFIAPCSTGGLNLTPPSSVLFPTITLNGTDKTTTTSPAWTADDETAAWAGWNIAATSTTFTNGTGQTLATTATTVTAAAVAIPGGNCYLPSNSIGYPVTLPAGSSPPTAVKVYNAAANTGGGPSTVTLTYQLSVPAKAYSGTYTSTWTLTMASGP